MSKRLLPDDLDRLLDLIAQNDDVLSVSALDAIAPGSAAHRLAEANELYWITEIARVSDGRLSSAEIDRAAQFLNTIEIQQAVFGPMAHAVEDLERGDTAIGLRLVWVRADSPGPGTAGVSSDQIDLSDGVEGASEAQSAEPLAALNTPAQAVSLSSFAAALDPAAQSVQDAGNRDDTASSSATGGRAGFNAALACLFLQTGAPSTRPYDGWEDFQARNGLTVDLVTDLKTAYPDGFAKLNVSVGLAAVASKRPQVADAVQASLAEQMEHARAIHNFDGLALLHEVNDLQIDIRLELPELIERHTETLDGLVAALPLAPAPATAAPADAIDDAALSGLPHELAATQVVVGTTTEAAADEAIGAVLAVDVTPVSPASTDLSASTLQTVDAAVASAEIVIASTTSSEAKPASVSTDVDLPVPAVSVAIQTVAAAVDLIVTVGAVDTPEADHDSDDEPSTQDSSGKDGPASKADLGGHSSDSSYAAYEDPVVVVAANGSPPQPAVAMRATIGADDPVPLDQSAAPEVRVVDVVNAETGGEWTGEDAEPDGDDCSDDFSLGETGAEFVMFALGSDTLVLQPEYLEAPDDAGEPEFWPNEQGPVIPDQIVAYGFNDDTLGADLWHALEVGDGAVNLDSDSLRLVSFDGNDSGRGDLLCL